MALAPAGKKNEFLEKLNNEIANTAPRRTATPQQTPPPPSTPQQQSQQPFAPPAPRPTVQPKNVHFIVEEKVNAVLHHDADVSLEIKGDVVVQVNDPKYGRFYTVVEKPAGTPIQYKTHPNIDKNRFTKESILILKNPARPLPSGTPLGVLKYRLVSTREEDLPITVSCWPSGAGDGTTVCNMEVELQQKHMEVNGVEVHIPTPAPATVEGGDGAHHFDSSSSTLMWQLQRLTASAPSASLEFRVPFEGDSAAFFPIRVGFSSASTATNFRIGKVCLIDDGRDVPYSVDQHVDVESFAIAYPQN
jgi:hypothetical protein